MAPKRNAAVSPAAVWPSTSASSARPSTAAGSPLKTSTPVAASSTSSSSSASGSKAGKQPQNVQEIITAVFDRYVADTPQRVKLLDAFMAFLVIVGALQFVYVCAVGNYPFNAFLSGFSATVGQFVLTASLRIQTNPANKAEFEKSFSDERAFADYVFGSLILHFFCINFIN